MENLSILTKDTITSLELLEQINFFRKQEGRKTETQHYDLLKIIRNEFDEEINEGKISVDTYKDKKGEERPMYILTLNQAKQVLMRESVAVRRAVIKYIEHLEKQLENSDTKHLKEQSKQMEDLESRIEALEKGYKQTQINDFITVSGYARLKGVFLNTFICSNIGKMATHICQTHNIEIKRLYDSRYGFINAYPVKVLENVFERYGII